MSHLRALGCRCFVLKEGNLDKFESRSFDRILLGYALQSRGYRVLILETNRIVETCNVTFDESTPSLSASLECAGDDEFGQDIFEDEDEPEAFEGDGGVPAPVAGPLPGDSDPSSIGGDRLSSRQCPAAISQPKCHQSAVHTRKRLALACWLHHSVPGVAKSG